jgi:hypothetical protein
MAALSTTSSTTLGAAVASSVLLWCTGCGPCTDLPADDGTCADLTFSGDRYDEWAPAALPAVTEELGDARYPACNDGEPCNGPDLDGHGGTDVWLLEGVAPDRAVIGFRQGTDKPVVFLRQGVRPADVPGLDAHARR